MTGGVPRNGENERAMTIKLSAAIWAGVAAGILSSVVEVLLWVVLTNQFPAALFRDVRLTAAMVMGPRALPPPIGFNLWYMAVATLIHSALSVIYGLAVAALVTGRGPRTALLMGALFGAALYGINLYGFTLIFPWFAQARDWVTLTAHLAFGITAAGTYRYLALTARRDE